MDIGFSWHPFLKEAVSSPLCNFGIFVKHKVTAAVWVFIGIFCVAPLSYMSLSVAVALQYNLKSHIVIPLFPRIVLAIWGLLCFQMILRLYIFFLAQRINKKLWKMLFFYFTLKYFRFIGFIFIYVHVCLSVPCMSGVACGGQRGCQNPGTGITGNCEPPDVDVGNQTQVLSKSNVCC